MQEFKYNTRDFGNIYRFIYKEKQSSRQQIAEQLDISLPTVTQNLNLLKESELIYTSGTYKSSGGRKANIFRCIPDARYAIGLNITQKHISFVLIDLDLNIIGNTRIRYPFDDTDVYYDFVGSKLEEFLDTLILDRSKILGVGISLPVIIEADHKTISYATVIRISGNIYNNLQSRICYPTLLFNDASSAGLAESWVSSTDSPALYLFLSSTVGGAFMDSGKLFTGVNYRASEFGHTCVVPHGRKCYCGCYGCLDAYCSAKVLSDLTGGNLELFFKEMNIGNTGYRRIFDEYMDYLAIAINNLRMCYDCDIILGGSVGSFMTEYIEEIREKAIKLNPFEKDGNYIRSCHYKTEAAAVGAAIYFINKFINTL